MDGSMDIEFSPGTLLGFIAMMVLVIIVVVRSKGGDDE